MGEEGSVTWRGQKCIRKVPWKDAVYGKELNNELNWETRCCMRCCTGNAGIYAAADESDFEAITTPTVIVQCSLAEVF